MDEEITIFSHVIDRLDENDNTLVAMTSDADTQLAAISVTGITIKNGLSIGGPVVVVNFVDGHGDLTNYNRLDTNSNYYLYFGRSMRESTRLPMRISKISFKNSNGGQSDTYAFQVFFVMSEWSSLLHKTHNRAWANVKYSTVVSQIASESNFNSIEVTDSSFEIRNVVQPHWTNLTLLRNIRSKATSRNSTGRYEFGVSLNREFFFMTLEDIARRAIERSEVTSEGSVVPVLRMGAYQQQEKDRTEEKKQNGDYPSSFTSFQSEERFMDSVIQGAGGVESQYYDFVNRRFVRTKHNFSDSDEKTLCDWSLVHPDNEINSLKLYGGREKDIADVAKSRVSDVVMSLSHVSVNTEGSHNFEIGGMVEVVIPCPPDKIRIPYNEMYSGFYYITEVEHIFRFGKRNEYSTNLSLGRQGIDGKDVSGLVPSSGGRLNV